MTLAQIRAMFEVGQTWHAVNTYRTGADGPRTLVEMRSTQFVWSNPGAPRFWMTFPKKSEVIEASPGRLVFRLETQDREGTVTLTREVTQASNV